VPAAKSAAVKGGNMARAAAAMAARSAAMTAATAAAPSVAIRNLGGERSQAKGRCCENTKHLRT
jgi:hypothetical protein